MMLNSDSVIDATIDRAEFAKDNWNSGRNEQKYRVNLQLNIDMIL